MTGMEWIAIIAAVGTVMNGLLSMHIKSKLELAKLAAEKAVEVAQNTATTADVKLDEIHKLTNSAAEAASARIENLEGENEQLQNAYDRIEKLLTDERSS